jgi:hypothetical protein
MIYAKMLYFNISFCNSYGAKSDICTWSISLTLRSTVNRAVTNFQNVREARYFNISKYKNCVAYPQKDFLFTGDSSKSPKTLNFKIIETVCLVPQKRKRAKNMYGSFPTEKYLEKKVKMSWGAHQDVMLIVYKKLMRSVLEYGCIASDQIAATHCLKLERIQNRCLTIALGLIQLTHVQALEVIGGVLPLRVRFSMLNHKYLISAFLTGGHPLRQLLPVLLELNSTKLVRKFGMVENYDLEPVHSVYDYSLALFKVTNVNDAVEQELTSYLSTGRVIFPFTLSNIHEIFYFGIKNL